MTGSFSNISSADPIDCQICGCPSHLYGVVDFGKSADVFNGNPIIYTGIPVYYRRCKSCGFVFSDTMLDWSADDFKREIYNDNYELYDPDYKLKRPSSYSELICRLVGDIVCREKCLDFGGGAGLFAKLMRDKGLDYCSFDPFYGDDFDLSQRFDFITAIEVLEHSNNPKETARSICSLLSSGGFAIITTLLQPANFDVMGLNWWYVSPRNGHISIYSQKSLQTLFGLYSFKVTSFSENLHLIYKDRGPLIERLMTKVIGPKPIGG